MYKKLFLLCVLTEPINFIFQIIGKMSCNKTFVYMRKRKQEISYLEPKFKNYLHNTQVLLIRRMV